MRERAAYFDTNAYADPLAHVCARAFMSVYARSASDISGRRPRERFPSKCDQVLACSFRISGSPVCTLVVNSATAVTEFTSAEDILFAKHAACMARRLTVTAGL